jgi:hypothetical protein
MTILARLAPKIRAVAPHWTSNLTCNISERVAVDFGEVVPAWRQHTMFWKEEKQGREEADDKPDLIVLASPVKLVLVDILRPGRASNLDCSISLTNHLFSAQ